MVNITVSTGGIQAVVDDSSVANALQGASSQAVIANLVAAQLATLNTGIELGYAEITSNWTTTNIDLNSVAAGSLVTGLSITVVGTGRPVEIEFYTPILKHSVANTQLLSYFVVNGVSQSTTFGQTAATSSPSAPDGRLSIVKRRVVLANGTSYTFQVGIAANTAGSSGILASPAYPSYLSVVSR